MGKDRVVIGMSGGVDSSVAAALLQEKGYEVIGVTMKTMPCLDEDFLPARDAKRVCRELSIPHHILDFSGVFQNKVIQPFMDQYLAGNTPNPCVVCNRFVKWEAMLSAADSFGADYMATGHYARIARTPEGRLAVRRAVSDAKDQTYALYGLSQEQLKRTLMPVGDYDKEHIREMAKGYGISVAEKPDSQEICFIPDHDYARYIEEQTGRKAKEGNFVDQKGNILGRHKGIIHYTVGQRKGLNISMGHPVFVVEIRPETNEVVIGENEDIFTREVYCTGVNPMAVEKIERSGDLIGKIRYGHKGSLCTVERLDETVYLCRFQEPVRAVTPGQAIVWYQGDMVAGGGTIIRPVV